MFPNFSHENQSLFHPPLVFKFVRDRCNTNPPQTKYRSNRQSTKFPSKQIPKISWNFKHDDTETARVREWGERSSKVDKSRRWTIPVHVWRPVSPARHSYTQRAPQINLVYAEICTATNHPVANYNRRNCVSYQAAQMLLLCPVACTWARC